MLFFRKKIVWLGLLLLGGGILLPHIARAVVPPDFIFNIGSQIAQIFSVVVLFLSAIFVTSYQFIKTKLVSLRSRKLFWVGSIIFILFAALLGAALYTTHKQNTLYTKWLEWFQRSGQKNNLEKQQYFYDRIIVYGTDQKKQPVLLSLDASREELKKHLFGHSYSANISYQGKILSDYVVFNSSSSSIESNKFITAFSHSTTPELPTETYTFSLRFKDKNFVFTLSDLNGDFLIKNRLNYLRYVSAGSARIQVGGETIDGKTMVDQVLSNDGAVPTLAGYNPKYVSHSIALWDEVGNFYHLDKSEAFSPEVPYASHTWMLYKDIQGASRKTYAATVDFKQDNKASVWKIVIPGLDDSVLNLKLNSFLRGKQGNFIALVDGTVNVGGREKKIAGYALFEDNR